MCSIFNKGSSCSPTSNPSNLTNLHCLPKMKSQNYLEITNSWLSFSQVHSTVKSSSLLPLPLQPKIRLLGDREPLGTAQRVTWGSAAGGRIDENPPQVATNLPWEPSQCMDVSSGFQRAPVQSWNLSKLRTSCPFKCIDLQQSIPFEVMHFPW